MPQVLKELMRHEDIQTTMRYYVGRNAQTTADALWITCEAKQAQEGTMLSTNAQSGDENPAPRNDESPSHPRAYVKLGN